MEGAHCDEHLGGDIASLQGVARGDVYKEEGLCSRLRVMLLATEDGLFEFAGGEARRRCCRGVWLVDAARWRGSLYLCSPDLGVLNEDGEVVAEGQCWALREAEGKLLALMSGPKIVEVGDGVVATYEALAEERGWHFPLPGYGPHFTDLARVGGLYVASTEVGDLMAGPSLGAMSPRPLFEDQHVLAKAGEWLLVGTASGIYVTKDLASFEEANGAWGYVHGIVKCGGVYVAQTISPKPIWVSQDGLMWENLPLVLEEPTFGTTNIACAGDKLLYAVRDIHLIDLKDWHAERLGVKLPTVYK
ncbi:hypothetical protein, partial [Pyrobaculum aerophilum]|uniref:hypothetical protein n=1 Tax=Pyrobaculum aerophilum TaxID=13773 RepID=UPI0023F23B20